MNSIEEAISSGYGEDEVLDFISKKYPELAKKITKSLSSGYSPKNILNFLSPLFQQKKKSEQLRGGSQQSVHAQKRHEDIEKNKQLMKLAAQAGLTTAGGVLAGRALQNVPFGQVGKKIGQSLGFQGPKNLGQAPMAEALGTNPGLGQAAADQGLGKIVSKLSSDQLNNLKVDLEKLNLGKKIEDLVGNYQPEVLGGVLDKQISAQQKSELENKYGSSFGELLTEYAKKYLQTAQQSPLSQESLTLQRNLAKREEEKQPIVGSDKTVEQVAKVPPEEKLVSLPDGKIGKIVDERQGITTVETTDGKKSRRKNEELNELSPEFGKQVHEVISSIPEDEKSRVLAFASYNPGTPFSYEGKEHNIPFMALQFHNGDFYVYPGINKEKFDKIISKATKAKTSGENEWGYWTKDDPSRGASFVEVKKEIEDAVGKNFIHFRANEGYDFWKRLRQELKKYFQKNKGR